MTARELFQAGKLDDAIKVLGAELRDKPADAQRRTFLFELLCFAGDLERAEKHLHILADREKDSQLGAMLYFAAVHAERLRREQFASGQLPAADAAPEVGCTLNGEAFGETSTVAPIEINSSAGSFA